MEKKKKDEIAYIKRVNPESSKYVVFVWIPEIRDYVPGLEVSYQNAIMLEKWYKETWIFETQNYFSNGRMLILKGV